jgi:hypothetical protein
LAHAAAHAWAFKTEKISGSLPALGFKGQIMKVKPEI